MQGAKWTVTLYLLGFLAVFVWAALLAGTGPLAGELAAAAEGLGGRVRLAGYVDEEEKRALLGAADLFVMTSTTEGNPLAVLEAMATGLPVVAVDACGTGDTVTPGRDGLLCDCDPDAFASILTTAVADRDLRLRMGEAARETAEQYSLESYARKLVELYRDVGAERPQALRS